MIGAAFVAGHFDADCGACSKWAPSERERQGCDGPQPFPVARLRDGTEIHECPGRMLTPETAAVCRLFSLLECGVSPCSGGALDQPASLMGAIALLGAEVGKYREDEAEKHRERRV